jgi:uncharacterized protein
MKKLAFIILTILVILYISICILVYKYQTKLMFFPDKNNFAIPHNQNILDTMIATNNGNFLNMWYITNNSKKCVLFCHGNGGNISYLASRLPIFKALQVNVILFDYKGYGKSSGVIESEKDLYTDANIALEYINQIGFADSNIIIWGQSLGGSVATEIAQNKKVKGVILESTFASMDAMGAEHYAWLPTTYLSKFHFASIDKIKNITAPILIMHSQEDEVISYKNGSQLFAEANEPKQFVMTKGFHNTAVMESREQYIKVVGSFLK